jgi:hypothetical protein
MTTTDFYQEVIDRHAISYMTFTDLVYAFFNDVPENTGPCIKNPESLARILGTLPDKNRICIHITEQDTNTDLQFEPQSGDSTYFSAILLRGICTIFQQSVLQFYKAKKYRTGAGMQTTIVVAVFKDGSQVYFGDLTEIYS